ncbi:DNA polymerase III subunit epsilon [Thalassospiraceae bacterium LMO-JJ14]|nr:DNA polymerase III subunit epsilon [Thalassospiraceae bacterium LMO-JJ14]
MREIVLDTETTGLDPKAGHRIVEIGCIELFNHVPTGEVYHQYINPERDMPVEAERVHGLSEDFLSGHPVFADVAGDFLGFVGDAPLVIHNAAFDMGFINAELAGAGLAELDRTRAIDTVGMARRKFPGAQASLDALCRRFGIDLSGRELHGALLDAQLLADVYLELLGGRQHGMDLAAEAASGIDASGPGTDAGEAAASGRREARGHAASAEELARHQQFLEKIKDPIWLRS